MYTSLYNLYARLVWRKLCPRAHAEASFGLIPTHAIEAGYRNRSPARAELLRVDQIHQLADVVLHNCTYANRAVVSKFNGFTKAFVF